MKIYTLHICLFIIMLMGSKQTHSQEIIKIDGTKILSANLNDSLSLIQKEAGVHGMSVFVVSNDSVLFSRAYGFKKIKEKESLNTTHNFYAASLSKPLFAFIVMKLVEEKVIALDTPLIHYLDHPFSHYKFKEAYEGFGDLDKDQRSKKITARMCLSHTSGLPNWRYVKNGKIKMNNPLVIENEPGSVYSYSGEGLQLLQLIIEQIAGKNLEELARQYIFDPLDMKMSSFTWQDRFEGNYAVGHYKKRKQLQRRKRTSLYAAGSMDTTPVDYSRFIMNVLAQNMLKKEFYNEMFKLQIPIKSVQQFGKGSKKITDANDSIQLGYGLGWGIYQTPYGKAIFKEGHAQGWEHYTVFYPDRDLGLIIMTNSSKGESTFRDIVKLATGDQWMPWYWENFIPYSNY